MIRITQSRSGRSSSSTVFIESHFAAYSVIKEEEAVDVVSFDRSFNIYVFRVNIELKSQNLFMLCDEEL